MTDQTPPPPPPPPGGFPPPPPPEFAAAPPPPDVPYGAPAALGPVGKVRSTGISILLFIVTFGIYGLVWFFLVHDEMKRHSGRGLGGLVALLLAFFVGIVMPYFTSDEVGKLQQGAGRPQTVSAVTGLWYFPGIFILVGPIIWFVKTNGALNDYWRSMGAPA